MTRHAIAHRASAESPVIHARAHGDFRTTGKRHLTAHHADLCECGRPATTYWHGIKVCQRCNALQRDMDFTGTVARRADRDSLPSPSPFLFPAVIALPKTRNHLPQ